MHCSKLSYDLSKSQIFKSKSLNFQAEKRKTINGEDILFAMSTLGFDNYVEPLKLYLQKYRESMKGEKQPGEGFEEIDDVICEFGFGLLCTLSSLVYLIAEEGWINEVGVQRL